LSAKPYIIHCSPIDNFAINTAPASFSCCTQMHLHLSPDL
jgi:hypothetical protein